MITTHKICPDEDVSWVINLVVFVSVLSAISLYKTKIQVL
jgi:hypothetical protein